MSTCRRHPALPPYLAIAAFTFATAAFGADVLFTEHFDDANLTNRRWYDGTAFRIVGDAFAGKGCIEYEWRTGDERPSASSGARRLFEPTEEVWLRFHLKLSKNWGWTGRNYHPHLLHFLTTENTKFHGPAASHLTVYVEPVSGKLRLAATDIQNKDMPHGLTQGPLRGGYNGTLYDSREVLFTDDKWHCIEATFKLNTLDLPNDRPNSNGVVRGWFDGKLVIEHTNVVLRSTDFPAMKFNQFLMTPYFGAGLLPHSQKLWIDELAVGTKHIGPLAAGKMPLEDYDVHIRNLAFNSSPQSIRTALKALVDAGTNAFPTLIAHLNDQELASPTFQAATAKRPTIGDACFDILQQQVEGAWPKAYRDYCVLSPGTTPRWLARHAAKPLRELRIEAARESLGRAEKDSNTRRDFTLHQQTLNFLRGHLHELEQRENPN
jgi:hypothetical protein